jgi:DNA-binding transcriptional LysR family regulator
MAMELRQLEHFVAIAEDESFTRAARRLGYVQSALSVSVRSLERELAVKLFDRTTHRVRLTDAGRSLLPAARSTLASAQAIRDEAAAVNGVIRGRLRIGVMQALTVMNVPRLLGRFHREHPEVEIMMRPAAGGATELLTELADGELDLALVAVADRPKGLRVLPLATERLLLTSSQPDTGRQPGRAGTAKSVHLHKPIDLRELADQSFVDFPAGWIVRTLVDRAFAALDIHRRVAIEVADVPACKQLIREGLGVALLPESIIAADSAGLQTRDVVPAVSWELAVVVRDGVDPSPAAAAFMDLVELERGGVLVEPEGGGAL